MAHEAETDSDNESTNSDFNFGDMTRSDEEEEDITPEKISAEKKEEMNTFLESRNCNLNVYAPNWFNHRDLSNESLPLKFHRNGRALAVMRHRCELLYAQRKYNEALAVMRDILMKSKVDYHKSYGNELHDILVRCLIKLNQWDEAQKYIDILLTRDVSFGTIQLIGKIYANTNENEKAFEYAMEMTKREPLHSIAWYQLAIASGKCERFDIEMVCLRILGWNLRHYELFEKNVTSTEYRKRLVEFIETEKALIVDRLKEPRLVTCDLDSLPVIFGEGTFSSFVRGCVRKYEFVNRYGPKEDEVQ